MTAAITTAIRADAAASDAEGRRDLAGHLADFRAALLDEAALIAASDRARHAREVATLTAEHETATLAAEHAHAQTCREIHKMLDGIADRLGCARDVGAAMRRADELIASRDSLQAEVDGLKADQQEVVEACNAVAAERDRASAASADLRAEREAWKAEVAELRAERNALRAEVDKLRARPVLTVDWLTDVLCGERVRGVDADGRVHLFANLGDETKRDIADGIIAALGPVTLPAQDRAEELAVEIYQAREVRRYGKREADADARRMALDEWFVADVRTALARVGAPEVTLAPISPSHVCAQCSKPSPTPAASCRDHEWIGVDLDGTLAHHDTWRGIDHIGDPVPAMLERVRGWLADGRQVRILTARVSDPVEADRARAAIDQWSRRFLGGVTPPVTCIKDMHMIELWDDRAITVEKNTGRDLRPGALPPISPDSSVQPPEVDSMPLLCRELIAWGEARARDRRADARLGEFRARLAAMESTPSKPADVFAGVSEDDLAATLVHAYGSGYVSHSDRVALRAVLDAIRVKLVAPVDPEAVARDFIDDAASGPRWCACAPEWRRARVANMRATLTANGIPVTPEAGK